MWLVSWVGWVCVVVGVCRVGWVGVGVGRLVLDKQICNCRDKNWFWYKSGSLCRMTECVSQVVYHQHLMQC